MPEQKLQIPFDPWTATEEEAKLENKRRRKLKEELAVKLKSTEPGTEEWHVVNQQLETARYSAVSQRTIACQLKKFLRDVSTLNGMDLIEVVGMILKFALPAPTSLGVRFHEVANRVLIGELTSWDEAFGRPPLKGRADLFRRTHGVEHQIFLAVEELLYLEAEKYVKRCEDPRNPNKKSVFKAVAEAIKESKEIKDVDGTCLTLEAKSIEKIYNRLNKEAKEALKRL